MRTALTLIRGVLDLWRAHSREPLTLHDLIGEPKYRITQPGKPFKARRTWERAMAVYINSRKVA